MTQSNPHVIEIHEISKSFGTIKALQNVSLNIPTHSIFGFLGPNGAGKTTLMKILLGLTHPSSGSARIFGYDAVHRNVEISRENWLSTSTSTLHRIHDCP